MAKASTKKTGTTKKELLDAAIAEAVGAGKELRLESVDFSDLNRAKTCLEVDFPIISINRVSRTEGSSGATRKPIYQMSKWWARRQSSVFRAMLIAAATKAPEDPAEAAKLVWDSYYGNHQKNDAFKKLKVADIFMGGGTTIVEGVRLGMQMFGNDLNPVAWFVVNNELTKVDPHDVHKLLEHIESKVKPQVMPFYACDCPRGHKGKWTQRSTGKVMGKAFDPLALNSEERSDYEYEGPELIYTFWAKHGPCQATGCGHRTPIISSPVIANKTLTVKAWSNVECEACGKIFDVEETEARMAPSVEFVVSAEEHPFVIRTADNAYTCPHCGQIARKVLGAAKNKSVSLSLLIHPSWLRCTPSHSTNGESLGGSPVDDPAATSRWNHVRAEALRLIEVRGTLPESLTLRDSSETIFTDERGGTVPRKSVFACSSPTCGRQQDVLDAIHKSGKPASVASYAIQGYCPECDRSGLPYSGRFFDAPTDSRRYDAAVYEWELNKNASLTGLWPVTEVPEGLETSVRTPLHKYNYKRWVDFFNPRQLLVHTHILKACLDDSTVGRDVKVFVLAAFQQYLRTQNMFCIWNIQADQLEPFFSKNNYQPPVRPIENGVFSTLGRGNWSSCVEALLQGLDWLAQPSELVATENLSVTHPNLATQLGKAKSTRVLPGDPPISEPMIACGSSTELSQLGDGTFDLVVTDPPFGDIMQYAEFSAFFYAWLKPAMLRLGVNEFAHAAPPTALEAVENSQRHNKDSPAFYSRMLTACWKEAFRILKVSGLLTFTFHHDKDGPWIAVLESLFNAGFYLEATFPVRSDETKGEGSTPGTFGAQKVEYDIVHVCRKRVDEPNDISWARLRRQILQDVRQLQDILVHHQQEGLQEADLQVIRRGKALEYYSKHYGKVYVEKGREFTVKEALSGINQLLDDQRDSTTEVPPVDAEPYSRQFLRLFADTLSLPRDQMQKFLRGTGVSPAEFEERGWCNEEKKVFHFTPPIEQARKWKGAPRKGLGRDLDQAMFLIGACYENSGINVNETLNNPNFLPHPATQDILNWFTRHGGDSQMKDAARLAKQLFTKWIAANEPKVKAAQRTFDFAEGEA